MWVACGDATYLVRSDTLSGSPDFKPEEGKHNLFDYTHSKFLTEKTHRTKSGR